MNATPVVILAVAAAVGVRLFLAGRRGRVVDDHPVCTRCRFDLSGRPDGGGNCPECGASLAGPRAVAVGNRARRVGLIYAGLTLAMAALTPLAATVGLAVTGVDRVRFTPTWLLLRDLRDGSSIDQSRARTELVTRVRRGSLSAADERRVVDHALARQADLALPWSTAWGDTIEYLNGHGRLTAADWKAYSAHDQPTTLVVGSPVRRGDPIPFVIHGELRGATLLTTSPPGLRANCSADIPGLGRRQASWGGVFGSPFSVSGTVSLPPADWPRLEDGPQAVSICVGGVDAGLAASPALFPPVTLTAPWVLAADGRGPVQRCRDDAVAARVRDAIWVRLEVDPAGAVDVVVRLDKPPVNLAYDLFVRRGGREWPAETPVCIESGQPLGIATARVKGDGLKLDDWVRVVLRPNVGAAAKMARVAPVLDYEMSIDSCRVCSKTP